jgi:hypothetical protein
MIEYRARRVERAALVAVLGILVLLVDIAVVVSNRVDPLLSLTMLYIAAAVTGAAVFVIWAEQAAQRGVREW